MSDDQLADFYVRWLKRCSLSQECAFIGVENSK